MDYKTILVNDAVSVIEVDGKQIQLSAGIDIDTFLREHFMQDAPVKKIVQKIKTSKQIEPAAGLLTEK